MWQAFRIRFLAAPPGTRTGTPGWLEGADGKDEAAVGRGGGLASRLSPPFFVLLFIFGHHCLIIGHFPSRWFQVVFRNSLLFHHLIFLLRFGTVIANRTCNRVQSVV